MGPVDVTVDDGGPHIAGAVALHPAVLCEDKALHSLAKVLNPAESDKLDEYATVTQSNEQVCTPAPQGPDLSGAVEKCLTLSDVA